MFFFKSYVASYDYVRRPGTDRISEEVKKKLRTNRKKHGLAVVNESRFSFHFFVSAR